MLTDRDDLELSIPQPKRPRKTLMDALTSPDSPPPLYTVQSVSGWMDGWTDGWMDRWMDRWMDGWAGGWMDGWMGGWMDG